MRRREWKLINLYSYCQLGMTPQQFYSKWDVNYEVMSLIVIAQFHRKTLVSRGRNYRSPGLVDLRHLALMDFLLEHFEEIPEEMRTLLCPPDRTR
jgi:hypothetical protein